MRPITLTMKAFGSFAEETTVPFDEFKSGLYLVVGETGAGKTTVFDAIVFALFGVPSGKNRQTDDLHSDFVEKSTDTSVRLVFEHKEKRYTVTRTIHFRKKRGTEDEYSTGTPDALLEQPDEVPVAGHQAVTNRCSELLGLNAEQFRKIVMLAQGEFSEFLKADSDKKSAILGQLFDNSEYLRFQNLLGDARKNLAEKRAGFVYEKKNVMESLFQSPADGAALWLPEDTELQEKLSLLLRNEQETVEALGEKEKDARKQLDEINTRKGAAQSDNRMLEDLAGKEAHLKELLAREEEMNAQEAQVNASEKALRRVYPTWEKMQSAQKKYGDALADLEKMRLEETDLKAAFGTAKTAVEGDAENERKLKETEAARRSINDVLPVYSTLEEKRGTLAGITAACETAERDLLDAQKQKEKDEQKCACCAEELKRLENAEAQAVIAEQKYRKTEERRAEFFGENGILAGVRRAQADETALSAETEKLNGFIKAAADAERAYHTAYQSFIAGQAGLLAQELGTQISLQGEAQCPVCRTAFRKGEPHAFAPLIEGTPSKEKVDALKADFERCEKERADQHQRAEKQKTELHLQKDTLLSRAQKLLPECASWEQLAQDSFLSDAGDGLKAACGEAEKAYNDALAAKNRKAQLQNTVDELNRGLKALSDRIENKKTELNGAEKQIAALTAELGALREQLTFETKEQACLRINELTKLAEELQKGIEEHRNAFNNARDRLSTAQGRLAEKEASVPGLLKDAETAQREYDAAIAENGFASPGAFQQALAPYGQRICEDWLERKKALMNAYRNDVNNTREQIAERREQTKDMKYTDLAALEESVLAASEAHKAAQDLVNAQNNLLDNHRFVYGKVKNACDALAETDGAWERLNTLADLAVGVTGAGGKLSFERYVMGTIFREVLEMANRRLDIMSGGRYSLVHSMTTGRANAIAGLEVEVLDAFTGKQRSAASISGGESFQVSLALALGLSDVVQSHAGGVSLDTLFIDEGFGTLDGDALDSAITVLNQLTEGNRLVGIISHVEKLEESIPQKLRVKKTAHGSVLQSELS